MDLGNLTSMFKHIFEKVFNKSTERRMSITLAHSPKEITCKGALRSATETNFNNPIKFWIGGLSMKRVGVTYLIKKKTLVILQNIRTLYETVKSDLEKSILDFYSILG